MLRGFTSYLRRHHVGLLALFLALGGTSFAAASYINGRHIKPHSIPKNRLTHGAIAALKGQRGAQGIPGLQGLPGARGDQGSAGAAGASGSQGPPGSQGATGVTGATGAQGSTGPQGLQGLQGSPGANGVSGWEYRVTGKTIASQANSGTVEADCTSGKKAFGGGVTGVHDTYLQVTEDGPAGLATGWQAWAYNSSPSYSLTMYVWAICAYAS